MGPGRLTKSDKFFFLPVGVILFCSAIWNWLHGWRDLYTVIWFLVGLNNLLLVGQRAWPQYRHYFRVLTPLLGIVVILVSAYLLWTYVHGS